MCPILLMIGWRLLMKKRRKKIYFQRSNPIARDLRTSKYQTRIIKNKKKEVRNDSGFDKRSVLDGW